MNASVQRIAVGSSNPAKIEAVRRAFGELYPDAFELQSVETDGGLSQPWDEESTRAGALHRARAALAGVTDAGWGIGLEGGMVRDDSGILVTSWIAACRSDGSTGLARTAGFYLPPEIADAVREGGELAKAWARIRGIEHVGRKDGTVGLLTHGRFPRARLYAEGVVLAVALANGEQR